MKRILRRLSDALIFAGGVLAIVARWVLQLYRHGRGACHAAKRLARRIVEVERRIRPRHKRAVFLYRAAHYLLYRLHLLPRWIKLLQAAAVIGIIMQPRIWEFVEHHREARRLYEFYYAYFYDEYAKRQKPDMARYYADYYAGFYAEYFTSDAYRDALRYALPEPTPQNMNVPLEQVPVAQNYSLYVTADGLQLIRGFEGLVLKPYKDMGGKMTVGYGHLVRKGENYGTISPARAEEIFRQDVSVAAACVKRLVKVPLNPRQYSALTSLVYNIGPEQFRRSTLLEALNDGDYEGAAKEFVRWKFVGKEEVRGLERRRAAEREMFVAEWRRA